MAHPVYLGYRAGSAAARALPRRLVAPVGRAAGHVGARLMPGRRAMVRRHQARVRPGLDEAELGRATDEVFASYARYWLESFRLPGMSVDGVDHAFREEGFFRVRDAIEAGNGAILAVPHLGGWEWGAFWLTEKQGLPVTAVAEPVEPPELADWFVGLRQDLGMEIIPLGQRAGSATARALADNRILALVCDRDINGDGVEVEFFGERTTLPGGPATLALRSGAPIFPAAVYFEGDTHVGVARPPLDTAPRGRFRDDVARITQDLARSFEELIEAAPDQWHLLQPNWPSDRQQVAAP